MEELDLLLEELALNSAGSVSINVNRSNYPSDGEETGAVCTGKDSVSVCSKVYSDISPPGAASLISSSPNKELDSILQDLMGLGPGGPASSTSPPSLIQKQSAERKTDGDQQENKESSSAASPEEKASIDSSKSKTIDDVLGRLSSDLEKIGVRTTAKGHCASCGKCIVGKMITALGEVWHPQHFVCVACKMELSTTGFFERGGQPYCEIDYHELFSPRCAYCKGSIVQNVLTALDQTWHPEHFFCTHCGGMFGPEGFLEKDGKPYCCKDFYHLFAPKCSGCGESVSENYLIAANGTWHPECFVCSSTKETLSSMVSESAAKQQPLNDCLKPFTGGCFMELDGRPLCSQHFHSRQGTLCSSCEEPITGRCISALNRKFHPEHFVCAFCLRQLSQGIFKEQKGKPYCSACFDKLFV